MNFNTFYNNASVYFESPYHSSGNYIPRDKSKYSDQVTIDELSTFDELLDIPIMEGDDINVYKNITKEGIDIVAYQNVDSNEFHKIFEIILEKTKLGNGLSGYYVSNVQTTPNHRKVGIATAIYIYLAKRYKVIISDKIQYDGAVGTWKKLSKLLDKVGLKMYIYNDITKDIKPYSTEIQDDEIWGTDLDVHMDIRLILVDADNEIHKSV